MSDDFEALAARVEAGDVQLSPGVEFRGRAARAEAARVLMNATGARRPEDVIPLAMGRPRVGTESGPSPQVRSRVPQSVKEQLTQVARKQRRSESEVVREALTVYLAQKAG